MHFVWHPGDLCSSLSTSYIPQTKHADVLSLQERRKRVSVTLVFLVWLSVRRRIWGRRHAICSSIQNTYRWQWVWGDCLVTIDPDRIRQKTSRLEFLGPPLLKFKPGFYVVSAPYKCLSKTISF